MSKILCFILLTLSLAVTHLDCININLILDYVKSYEQISVVVGFICDKNGKQKIKLCEIKIEKLFL